MPGETGYAPDQGCLLGGIEAVNFEDVICDESRFDAGFGGDGFHLACRRWPIVAGDASGDDHAGQFVATPDVGPRAEESEVAWGRSGRKRTED